MTLSVALIVFPGVQALDVTGPLDVFAEANAFLPPHKHYQLEVLGLESGLLACSNGLSIQAHRHFTQARTGYDLVLCAGGPALPHQDFGPDFDRWLRAICRKSRRFGSICNGALMLARAGLLNGRHVTTHWSDVAELARLCPTAKLEADRLYVQDDNLFTSAGVTAGIDLSLYVLSQDHGPEVALNVAKRLVVFTQRSGGQSQFSPFLTPTTHSDSPVAAVQYFVQTNLRGDLTIRELAQVANMSPRNFSRVFARDTGITPAQFVEGARVDAARGLLENPALALKTVAYECGFRDAHHLRSVFMRRLGVSPQQLRMNFAVMV
ncbi:GlxA family transcriptional regulator [Pseudomonas sp. NPDC096917]|uniref:GlxA family transcriptional regulator n=1 Tax=Pseudomonas sp. NPDC096917 TaxID=3364483 RepID=UPI00383B967A